MNTKQRAKEMVPILCATFPRTFFNDDAQIKPLKIKIREDLIAWFNTHGLPEGYGISDVRNGLSRYCDRPAYQQAALTHDHRVDLGGNVAGEITPEARVFATQFITDYIPRHEMLRKKREEREAVRRAAAAELQAKQQAAKAARLAAQAAKPAKQAKSKAPAKPAAPVPVVKAAPVVVTKKRRVVIQN